jgi:hypothetical protein
MAIKPWADAPFDLIAAPIEDVVSRRYLHALYTLGDLLI